MSQHLRSVLFSPSFAVIYNERKDSLFEKIWSCMDEWNGMEWDGTKISFVWKKREKKKVFSILYPYE